MSAAELLSDKAKNMREAARENLVDLYEELVAVLLDDLGYNDATSVQNLRETASRAANGFLELVRPLCEIEALVSEEISRNFPIGSGVNESCTAVRGIKATGICPHHLLPVIYDVALWIDVAPGQQVLGLSKYARIADLLCKRPILQEQYAQDLAAVFTTGWRDITLGASGCLVLVTGQHMCAVCRGVRTPSLDMRTLVANGTLNSPERHQNFLRFIEEGSLFLGYKASEGK